jgi:hypothetical protein
MTELAVLTEAYKREVAIPGTFATDFPTITDDAIRAALGDAFAEAQLDGFFGAMTLDTDYWETTPDLSTAGTALVVIYAGIRVLRQRLLNQGAENSYKSGPVEYQTRQNSSAQTELLKELERRKNQIILNAGRAGGTEVFMLDGYLRRGDAYYGGLYDYETCSYWTA